MIQSPKGKIRREDYVWVIMTPMKLASQSVGAERGTSMEVERIGEEIKIIAPEQIMYSMNHAWGEYESMSTRLLGKMGDAAKVVSESKNMTKGSVRDISSTIGKGVSEITRGNVAETGRQVYSGGMRLQNALGRAKVANVKIDTPLVYENSERRQVTFEFNLVAIENAKIEVYDIVKTLEYYAAPTSIDNLRVNPPYIFSIRTEPGNIVWMSKSVLESIQPTWKAPYNKEGLAQSCQLTLTFKDMKPLYKGTLDEGGYTITTGTK